MKSKAIDKDKIVVWLDELIRRYEVWAPVRRDDAESGSPVVLFDRIAAGPDAVLDFANTRMSAKEVFFPRTEVMFLYDGLQVEEPPRAEGERVLFGVRPCDAASFCLLDSVFDTPEYPSVYYGDRRARTYVVVIGCTRPLNTCFCTTVGSGPCDDKGADVLLSDVGTKYVVQAITEKGESLLEGAVLLQEATPDDLREQARLAQEAAQRVSSGVVIEGLKERLDTMFDNPLWALVAEKCLGCGVCAYVCPTCHCFDVLDEADWPGVAGESRGRRVRIWDCCQYPLFTQHASGHNPRPSGTGRIRQRIMHKFHYFVENFGETACIGCGRCVRNCPVNLDIREVLNRIMER
jgi:sulfhydrogenase subunit beta (sulfur reductase)